MANAEEEILDLTAVTPEKCRVCGKTPASKVYGSIACQSCKVFFMRATTSGTGMTLTKCQASCSPPIELEKYRCSSCRLKKCFEVGMDPEATARRRGCQLREKRAQVGLRPRGRPKKEPILNCLKASTSVAPDSREVQLATTCYSAPISMIVHGEYTIESFLNLQRLAACKEVSSPILLDFPFFTGNSLHEALRNPTIVCQRTPMHSERPPDIPADCAGTLVGRAFSRFFVFMADWCRGVPEFSQLDENDQLSVFCRNICSISQFEDYYRTYKMNFQDGLLIIFGMPLKVATQPHFQGVKPTYDFHMTCGLDIVIPCMKKTEMGDEEFVLMKNILLFSSDLGLKEKSAQVVRKAFRKYSSMLLEHLKTRFVDEQLVISKFTQLMMIPQCMQDLGAKMARQFCRNLLTKQCGMVGTLADELFIRL
ncbi:unnamed protein product, partial [Mesorhabditis belari]|uniref:Uncharacterized protein n=1 Tax=Mesorhabditis belari TaxID=2138241 RepID=A0AAF3JAY1_9BILA